MSGKKDFDENEFDDCSTPSPSLLAQDYDDSGAVDTSAVTLTSIPQPTSSRFGFSESSKRRKLYNNLETVDLSQSPSPSTATVCASQSAIPFTDDETISLIRCQKSATPKIAVNSVSDANFDEEFIITPKKKLKHNLSGDKTKQMANNQYRHKVRRRLDLELSNMPTKSTSNQSGDKLKKKLKVEDIDDWSDEFLNSAKSSTSLPTTQPSKLAQKVGVAQAVHRSFETVRQSVSTIKVSDLKVDRDAERVPPEKKQKKHDECESTSKASPKQHTNKDVPLMESAGKRLAKFKQILTTRHSDFSESEPDYDEEYLPPKKGRNKNGRVMIEGVKTRRNEVDYESTSKMTSKPTAKGQQLKASRSVAKAASQRMSARKTLAKLKEFLLTQHSDSSESESVCDEDEEYLPDKKGHNTHGRGVTEVKNRRDRSSSSTEESDYQSTSKTTSKPTDKKRQLPQSSHNDAKASSQRSTPIDTSLATNKRNLSNRTTPYPHADIRLDQIGHFPIRCAKVIPSIPNRIRLQKTAESDEANEEPKKRCKEKPKKRGKGERTQPNRCRRKGCRRRSLFWCEKCNVCLCIGITGDNCFERFHTDPNLTSNSERKVVKKHLEEEHLSNEEENRSERSGTSPAVLDDPQLHTDDVGSSADDTDSDDY